MKKGVWIALAIVVVVGGIVLLLFTGGSSPQASGDAADDVAVGTERKPPEDASLADLVASEVTVSDGEVRFEATLGADIPNKIPDGSLELRWDLLTGGTESWIVQVNVNIGVSAAITSQQTNYGSSTVDDTLPGEVTVEGDSVTLLMDTGQIKGFPSDFQWRLTSTLDASMSDTRSAVATDTLPDSGANDVR